MNTWASQYFTWSELQCKRTGTVRFPRSSAEEAAFWPLLSAADEIRQHFGRPLVCRSGHRSTTHNLLIGGALRSMHLLLAMDLAPRRQDWPAENYEIAMAELAAICETFDLGGLGKYKTFIHIDQRQALGRPRARWEDNATWRRYESAHP